MLLHIGNRKGTKDGRSYPALSTRDFVVNNASPWRRTRRSESWQSVRSGWPLAISLPPPLSLIPRIFLLSLRTLFPSHGLLLLHPYISLSLFLSPQKPVAHKLIRSRCLLARDPHWPPYSHAVRFVRFVALAFLPFPLPPAVSLFSAPHGIKITLFSGGLFSRDPKYSPKLRDRTVPASV